jgi:hypothetical protein
MATINELKARLIDIFGPVASAVATKLFGNLMVSPAGNVLVGTTTDNGVQKLQVNGNVLVSGYMARTAQIAFCASQYYYQTNNFATNQSIVMCSNAYWGGTTVVNNNGNGFNIANGAFTAPVAGIYVFNANLTTVNGDTYFQFYKNGSAIGNQWLVYTTGSNWATASATIVLQLNAGDYVQVVAGSNNSTTAQGYGNSFQGFLL